jgi:drug/metabolite transporter (DMT)-like permease
MLGKVFLGEDVGSNRWVGTCMIFAGVVLVGSTPERSAAAEMVKSRYTGENCLKQ